ncbi:hypothetical protein HYV89_04510 [Candidatus Woesearchaeota archaeon]|nr:hypothetical protein [Candidatus Woesearchaeota archaeon]
MKLPKILVGCPTSSHKEYCLKEYAEAVKKLTYKNQDLLLVDNSQDDNYLEKIKSLKIPVMKGPHFESARDRIVASRNILRQKVLDGSYDYLFSLEQDVLPQANIIERLLKPKEDIISALYFMPNSTSLTPMLAIKESNGKYGYLPFNYADKNNNLIKVNYAGLGAILISRRVLEKVRFRIDKKPGFDDWFFCKDAEGQGFKIYADLSLKCRHLLNKRPWNWSELEL